MNQEKRKNNFNFNKEQKNFLYLLWVRITITAFVLCFSIMLFLPKKPFLLFLWALIYVFFFSVYAPLYVKSYNAEISSCDGEKLLKIFSGVFFKSERIVFFRNIQYVRASCGVFERLFKKETLTIYTAGARIFLRGVSPNSKIRSQLLSLKEGNNA